MLLSFLCCGLCCEIQTSNKGLRGLEDKNFAIYTDLEM